MRSLTVIVLFLALLTGGWLLSGCQPGENTPFASETDEPHYRRGMQLERAGRQQEALEAFLKVVEKRGGDAPESHLECGVLYLEHVKDSIAAIYHFRKYLELRPNSPQASHVRELIDTANKEYLRTLPAKPFEGQVSRLDLLDTVEKLQKENFDLKEQVARLRGLPPPPLVSRPPEASGGTSERGPASGESEAEAVPAVPVASLGATPPATAANPPAARTPTPPPPAAGGRVHVVQKGESLYSISRQHYGNGNRVDDIAAANRDLLRDRNTPLKIGMRLQLP